MEDDRVLQTEGLRFGPLGGNWVHICVDMQRLFAEGEWRTPWMVPVLPAILTLVEADPARPSSPALFREALRSLPRHVAAL